MVAELDPVVVEPSAVDDGVSIKMRYVVTVWLLAMKYIETDSVYDLRSEEGSEDISNETTNAVDRKDVEGVIAAQEVLELSRVVASNTTAHTEDHRSPSWNVSGTRSNADETSDDTRAESNSGPLAFETVVNQAPCDTPDTSSKVGAYSGHNSAKVSGQRGTSVETEPAHPEEHGADDDVRDVVGTVVELLGTVTASLSEHVRVGEGSTSGSDMNGSSAGKVQATHLEDPSGWVPGPARNRVVDNRRPDKHVDDARQHASSLGHGSNGKCNTAYQVSLDPTIPI